MDFLTHLFTSLAAFASELMGLWIIFSNTHSLAGWNAWEFLALLGVFRIITGTIGLLIAPNMRLIMEDVREGTLDFVLIKPVNSQFFVSVRRIVIWRVADILLGAIIIVAAGVKLSAVASAGRAAMFMLMLTAGVTIIYSFWLVLATLAFWLTRVNNMEMVFWNVFEAGRYPVEIYRPVIRLGLTYIVPLAFITTFPAAALVGRTNLPGVGLAVAFAAGSLAVASSFWNYGLRHYSGASA